MTNFTNVCYGKSFSRNSLHFTETENLGTIFYLDVKQIKPSSHYSYRYHPHVCEFFTLPNSYTGHIKIYW